MRVKYFGKSLALMTLILPIDLNKFVYENVIKILDCKAIFFICQFFMSLIQEKEKYGPF